MKTITFFTALFFAAHFNSLAQIGMGQKFIGGTFSLSSEKDKSNDVTTTDFNISPSFGYFLSGKLSLGGTAGYDSHAVKWTDSKNATSSFVIGPFLREYFSMGDEFALFLQEQLMLSFGSGTDESTPSPASNYNSSSISVSVNPGLIFFPNNKFGVEAGLGSLFYKSQKDKGKDSDYENTNNSFGLNVNLNTMYFGMRYYF